MREQVDDQVQTVILFGSIARGEATTASDIDLAVIAPTDWDGRSDLEDAVRTRFGNACDVMVFAPEDFTRLATAGEPVVGEILADGVALVGSIPRVRSRAACWPPPTSARHNPAAGDAIHAGISVKDAIATALTGSSSKGNDHAMAAKELRQCLGQRPEAPTAEKGLRGLLSAKRDVEYGVALVTGTKAELLVQAASSTWGSR